jgi:hypothetical protein
MKTLNYEQSVEQDPLGVLQATEHELEMLQAKEQDLLKKLEELAGQDSKTDQDRGYITAINDVINYLKERN